MSSKQPSEPPKVCIIGAGISGLVTAKVFANDGFDVCLFEKARHLGGVWDPDRRYPGVRANNSVKSYAFSDFPYPESSELYPTGEHIYDYLKAYAEHFDLLPKIQFSTTVEKVSKSTAPDLPEFKVVTVSSEHVRSERFFDFVVVCNGICSTPSVPSFEGADGFEGQIIHSSEFNDTEIVRGRKVVVVGAGKSAFDCAETAAKHASSTTLVFRRPYWMAPRFLGRATLDQVWFNRFAEVWIAYHTLSKGERLLHGPGRPVVDAWWSLISLIARTAFRMPAELTPKKFPRHLEKGGVVDAFYDKINSGIIAYEKASIKQVAGPKHIELDNGKRLDVDVIICATGWSQVSTLLDTGAKVRADGNWALYRNILPPDEPHLGFIGYSSSLACQLTAEVAAHWLSDHFSGKIVLPSRPEMEKSIDKVLSWAQRTFPYAANGYHLGPFVSHYVDELLGDMNLETHRSESLLAEFFRPNFPSKYEGVTEERRRRGTSPRE